ncbi:hypothetical protein FOZ63_026878 [Perkinsus olseni]|uniref:Phosphoglycerate mutase n=1 Tax=Perkinsus olseni TaxID=32597 RepID=A0A7J6R5Y2_PEROL|nr:hypothetical protein FOZ63_026878 [Perkinsus olseni]
MPVHVVFVRHAESANNKRGTNDTRACDGSSEAADERTGAPSAKGRVADPALTERGSSQAEVTARWSVGKRRVDSQKADDITDVANAAYRTSYHEGESGG